MFDGEAAACKAHHDMQKLAKIFMAGESVRLTDWQAILKKPRYNNQKINKFIS